MTRRRAPSVLLALLAALAGPGCVATRVGAGFAAHVACSLHFTSGQDPERVFDDYIRHEIGALGPLVSVEVGEHGVLGRVVGIPRAQVLHRPGLGCTQVFGEPPAGGAGVAPPPRFAFEPEEPWPHGDAPPAGPPPAEIAAALDRAFAEPDPEGGYRRQTTAIAIAHRGRLVAERYAPGYGPGLPMLSWSMAKSVLAALVGIAVEEGRLDLWAPAPVPEWRDAGDARAAITLDQLMRMSSSLEFEERYAATTDASVMLFARADTGGFAARKPLRAPPGAVWSYSSGTSNLVARILRQSFDDDVPAMVGWARERLFLPADMRSAFLEPDASGSFIGSSFAFMTLRDWARFGELHRRDGEWRGRRVLPEGWVRYVTTPTLHAPRGEFGAHWWLNAGPAGRPGERVWSALPPDAYAARGHSGQWVLVVPSHELVVVRLGLSHPDNGDEGVVELAAAVIAYYADAER